MVKELLKSVHICHIYCKNKRHCTFMDHSVLISAHRLGVYYFLSLTLSVCPSVCHKHCFFFFVSRRNRAIFGPSVHHGPLYKTLFLHCWLRPPKAQNLLPQICTKSPITRLVRQIDGICLGLPGGFRDGQFNTTMQNVVGPTVVAMATKFGLCAEIMSPTGLY